MLRHLALVLLTPFLVNFAAAQPSQVIVVRHAERALEPAGDPSLSSEGHQRAELLAETLSVTFVPCQTVWLAGSTVTTGAPTTVISALLPLVALGTVALTVFLYIVVPKGFFPVQDNGLIQAVTEAPQSISFAAMSERQRRMADAILGDPDVAMVGPMLLL